MTCEAATAALQWVLPAPVKRVPVETLLPLIRAGAAAAPDRVDLALQLAKTLFQADRMEELVERFCTIVTRGDADAELLSWLGRAAAATGDLELAVTALRAAADRGFDAALGPLAQALRREERSDEALASALRGLERSPADFRAMESAARLLLERRDQERLWELCAGLRAAGTWNAFIPSAMALAATTAAQDAEVAKLVDSARWFAAEQLGVADGFNEALADELLSHAALGGLPSTKATSGSGKRVDRLQHSGGPRVRELLGRVRSAVDDYVRQRRGDAAHPMIAQRPAHVALDAWALAVQCDGHESWHMHPGGWISGVYYVAIPRIDAPAGAHAGAIEFGPSPFAGERDVRSWPRAFVTPRTGMLLLFPSYYGHRTWPTRADDPRIVVAFDVVPAPPVRQRSA